MTDKSDEVGDTVEEQTLIDEAAMDRAAQAGVSGAFDAASDNQTREQMREDAEEAFEGEQS